MRSTKKKKLNVRREERREVQIQGETKRENKLFVLENNLRAKARKSNTAVRQQSDTHLLQGHKRLRLNWKNRQNIHKISKRDIRKTFCSPSESMCTVNQLFNLWVGGKICVTG